MSFVTAALLCHFLCTVLQCVVLLRYRQLIRVCVALLRPILSLLHHCVSVARLVHICKGPQLLSATSA